MLKQIKINICEIGKLGKWVSRNYEIQSRGKVTCREEAHRPAYLCRSKAPGVVRLGLPR